MVNILVHQFQSGGGVVDEPALEQFQKQWATYQKVVDADGLSHKAVGKILHDTLNHTFAKPFSFLDIACGDASQMQQALAGTKIRHYQGIDLSEPALPWRSFCFERRSRRRLDSCRARIAVIRHAPNATGLVRGFRSTPECGSKADIVFRLIVLYA